MKRLFLLEDDLSLINGLSFAVKKQGYDIVIARTALEADTLWADGKYDLVILDVLLPDGSGFDFAKRYVRLQKCLLCFLLLQMKKQILSWGLTLEVMIILQNLSN